ncbi:MAG: hypothetical protein ACRCVD_03450 [Halioglobus sp.]
MSDLSTGSAPDFPANWGFPSSIYNYCTGEYEQGGMIWYGPRKCTVEDVIAVLSDPRTTGQTIDRLTVCGTEDPNWTTYEAVHKTMPCYKQSYKP